MLFFVLTLLFNCYSADSATKGYQSLGFVLGSRQESLYQPEDEVVPSRVARSARDTMPFYAEAPAEAREGGGANAEQVVNWDHVDDRFKALCSQESYSSVLQAVQVLYDELKYLRGDIDRTMFLHNMYHLLLSGVKPGYVHNARRFQEVPAECRNQLDFGYAAVGTKYISKKTFERPGFVGGQWNALQRAVCRMSSQDELIRVVNRVLSYLPAIDLSYIDPTDRFYRAVLKNDCDPYEDVLEYEEFCLLADNVEKKLWFGEVVPGQGAGAVDEKIKGLCQCLAETFWKCYLAASVGRWINADEEAFLMHMADEYYHSYHKHGHWTPSVFLPDNTANLVPEVEAGDAFMLSRLDMIKKGMFFASMVLPNPIYKGETDGYLGLVHGKPIMSNKLWRELGLRKAVLSHDPNAYLRTGRRNDCLWRANQDDSTLWRRYSSSLAYLTDYIYDVYGMDTVEGSEHFCSVFAHMTLWEYEMDNVTSREECARSGNEGFYALMCQRFCAGRAIFLTKAQMVLDLGIARDSEVFAHMRQPCGNPEGELLKRIKVAEKRPRKGLRIYVAVDELMSSLDELVEALNEPEGDVVRAHELVNLSVLFLDDLVGCQQELEALGLHDLPARSAWSPEDRAQMHQRIFSVCAHSDKGRKQMVTAVTEQILEKRLKSYFEDEAQVCCAKVWLFEANQKIIGQF